MKLINRKLLFFTFVICIIAAFGACSKTGTDIAFNQDANGNAVNGYDTVAYFAVNNAVKGNPNYEYVWNGVKWLFSNEENKKKFEANPEAYAPQFGGYCSYAVSEGYTANGDPEAWKIVNGKLYLNYNQEVKQTWEKNEAERIEKGKANWQEFKTKKPEHKG